MVFRTAMKVDDGLPPPVMIRMLFNVVFDFLVGIVPFIGDLADAAFRANTRNAAILESHLREKGKKSLRKSGLPLPDVDPSLGEEFDRIQDDSDVVTSQPRPNEGMRENGRSRMAEPEAASVRGDGGRGYRGGTREPDLEMGQVSGVTEPPRSKSKKSKQQRRS